MQSHPPNPMRSFIRSFGLAESVCLFRMEPHHRLLQLGFLQVNIKFDFGLSNILETPAIRMILIYMIHQYLI